MPHLALDQIILGSGLLLGLLAAVLSAVAPAPPLSAATTGAPPPVPRLGVGVALAVARYELFKPPERLAAGEKLWWTFPLIAYGSLLVGQIAARAAARAPAARLLVTAALAAAILAVFALRFPRYLPLLPPIGAG